MLVVASGTASMRGRMGSWGDLDWRRWVWPRGEGREPYGMEEAWGPAVREEGEGRKGARRSRGNFDYVFPLHDDYVRL